MTKVLILGANGLIDRVATELFMKRPDIQLTLLLRRARRSQLLGPGPPTQRRSSSPTRRSPRSCRRAIGRRLIAVKRLGVVVVGLATSSRSRLAQKVEVVVLMQKA